MNNDSNNNYEPIIINNSKAIINKDSFLFKMKVDFNRNKSIYPIAIFIILFFFIFSYIPIYGLLMAFQDYNPYKGFLASDWVGFKHFINFFESDMFFKVFRNTFVMSITGLVFSFPMPLIFALLLNEITSKTFRRTIQTISYMPHFISIVIVCGMIIDFFTPTGLVNQVLSSYFGIKSFNYLGDSNWFLPLFIGSGVWQGVGYGSIIYLSAICGVNTELFDALMIDGGGRIRRVWNVILPSIVPTIVTLLILRLGMIMTVDFEKVLLLQNSINTDVSEVISTLTYKIGIMNGKYSSSTAIGMFNTVINLVFLLAANKISAKVNETSLW